MMAPQKQYHDQGAIKAVSAPGDSDESVEEVVRPEESPVCNTEQLGLHGHLGLPAGLVRSHSH